MLVGRGLAASDLAKRLSGMFGLDHESAAQLGIGGSAEQMAEGLAAYEASGADTLVAVDVGDDPLENAGVLGAARALL